MMIRAKEKSKSVFYVIGTLDIGGAERHLVDVSCALAGRGWDVSVYCVAQGGPLLSNLENGGVRVFLPPPERFGRRSKVISAVLRRFWAPIAAIDFWLLLMRKRPTIVHCFLPGAYILGAPAAIAAMRPIKIMSRRSMNIYQENSRGMRLLERAIHPWMTAALGNSQQIAKELLEEGFAKERIGIIYNGIDFSRFANIRSRNAKREQLALNAGALVFVIVANLIPYKGHTDLLRALALANPWLPAEWRLLVVGRDDGIGEELRRQAARLGIANSVQFLGGRMDVPEIMHASDIGILASHQEGFSNALLEGMAAGLAMIATDVGGNSEAISHKQTGLIVPPKNPTEMAKALIELANNADLRKQLAAAAAQRARSVFSLRNCVDAYHEFYDGLMAGKLPAQIESDLVQTDFARVGSSAIVRARTSSCDNCICE